MRTKRWRHLARLSAAAILPAAIVACGGKEQQSNAGGSASAAAATPSTATTGGAAPAGTTSTASGSTSTAAGGGAAGGEVSPSSITPQMVALGDSIFHGQAAGGLCYSCHGPDAKGTPTAPNLTDAQWLNGDGTYGFIVHTVTTGVPQPKQHPAPMPPMGGSQLSPDQINAVAAYVYSLSHPNVGKKS